MTTALEVAKYLLAKVNAEDSEEGLSNLKLQKLLYYVQGFSLAILGRKAFDDEIYAWQHGPVVPEVYHAFKINGANAILVEANSDSTNLRPELIELIDEVYSVYGQFSAWKLRDMTHNEPPWMETSVPSGISVDKLKAYFLTQIQS